MSESEGSSATAGNRISQGSGSKEDQKPIIRGGGVNPITGQSREFEKTVEELEREAEKLFVLFERCILPSHREDSPKL
jgi:hypothetical protein